MVIDAQHNNGMHATADTPVVVNCQRLGAVGDAWRQASRITSVRGSGG